MPFAKLTIIPAPSAERAETLALELTELIVRDLGKKRELTSVLIDTPGEAGWMIGQSVRRVAAHLDVSITAGTNSIEEKRTFLASAMALLRSEAPDLHQATYIVLSELPSENWGFDGRSQMDRAINPG